MFESLQTTVPDIPLRLLAAGFILSGSLRGRSLAQARGPRFSTEIFPPSSLECPAMSSGAS
jgi:hypothetical protein